MKKIKANFNTRTRWEYVGTTGSYRHVKVVTHRWSVPADDASYEQMVSQAHAAIANDPDYAGIAHHQYLDLVHTVLASIGIIRPSQ